MDTSNIKRSPIYKGILETYKNQNTTNLITSFLKQRRLIKKNVNTSIYYIFTINNS